MMVESLRAVTTSPNTGLEDSSRGVRACSIEPQSCFQERRPQCGTAHFLPCRTVVHAMPISGPNTSFQRTQVRALRGLGPLNSDR